MDLLDIFSGCGGASLGFKEAGYEIKGAIDIDQDSCTTYENNLKVKPLIKDILNLEKNELLSLIGMQKGELDVIIGCPPCQSFSSLRRTTMGNSKDSKDNLVLEFANIISEIKPKSIVFENVSGINLGRGKVFLDKFLNKIKKLGYIYVAKVVNAADFGVPQFRKRLVCIAVDKTILNGIELQLPNKTHSDPKTADILNLPKWQTVRDAIGDLPKLKSGERTITPPNHFAKDHTVETLNLIKHIPKDGGGRKNLPKNLWLKCHKNLEDGKGAESVYGRLWWDKPSSTMTSRCTTPSSGRFIHPEQDRGITPREAARFQTFPDDFTFHGSRHSIERQIGNAMPVELMRVIALKLKEILN